MSTPSPRNCRKGFSLTEVLITLATLGLLAGLMLSSGILGPQQNAKQSSTNQTAEDISKTASLLAVEKGLIPSTLSPLQVIQSKISLSNPSPTLVAQSALPAGCKALLGNGSNNFYQVNLPSKNQQVFISQNWVNKAGQDTGLACVQTQGQQVASLSQFTRGGQASFNSLQQNAGENNPLEQTNSTSTSTLVSQKTTPNTAQILTTRRIIPVSITFEGSTAGIPGATLNAEATGTATIGDCVRGFTTPALFTCSLPENEELDVVITSNNGRTITTKVTILPATTQLNYDLSIKKTFSALGSLIMDLHETYGNLYMISRNTIFAQRYLRMHFFTNVMEQLHDFVNNIYLSIYNDVNSDRAKQYYYAGSYMGQQHANAVVVFGMENDVFSGYMTEEAKYMQCVKNCVNNIPISAGVYVYNNPTDSSDPKNGFVYKGNTVWNSPVKLSLTPANAFLNSDNRFAFDLDGFNQHNVPAVMTPGGLNVGEAWLVYDRHHNGIWQNGTLDNDDVFGDHQGRFKNGYEDLAQTFAHEIKTDSNKHPYLELKDQGLLHYVAYVFGRWFNHAKPDASIELKLLDINHKLVPAYTVAQKLYLNYHNVKEIDAKNTNAIFQRANVEYNNGHTASSADQWFNLSTGSYTKLPKAEAEILLKEIHLK